MQNFGSGVAIALLVTSASASAADFDVAGLKVGMSADDVVAIAKQTAADKKPSIRQEMKPDRSGSFVSYVIWDDSSQTHYQVTFSPVSEKAKQIDLSRNEKLGPTALPLIQYNDTSRNFAPEYRLKDDWTSMLQAATKKFGKWTLVQSIGCQLQWGGKDALVEYCEFPGESASPIDKIVTADIRLTSPATEAAETAALEAVKAKPPAPKLRSGAMMRLNFRGTVAAAVLAILPAIANAAQFDFKNAFHVYMKLDRFFDYDNSVDDYMQTFRPSVWKNRDVLVMQEKRDETLKMMKDAAASYDVNDPFDIVTDAQLGEYDVTIEKFGFQPFDKSTYFFVSGSFGGSDH